VTRTTLRGNEEAWERRFTRSLIERLAYINCSEAIHSQLIARSAVRLHSTLSCRPPAR
jgi:hypothetical protein